MFSRIFYYLSIPLYIPHLLLFLIMGKKRLKEDLLCWGEVLRIKKCGIVSQFLYLIHHLKEYRSVFYWRIGGISRLVCWYLPGMPCLFLQTLPRDVECGFVIQHGHSTQVNAKSIGTNCQIWHNVTIGKSHPGGNVPVIKNNVRIFTGAVVIGDIEIGNNVDIGACTLLTKSVPDNCLVVGNPARIVRLGVEKVNILL